MTDRGSVERELGSLERFAPDEGAVLAGFRSRVDRRRRSRQVASVVGVAGTAAAVALGVVFALPDRSESPGVASPATSAPESPPPSKVDTALPSPALPFTVNWLPSGYALARWDVSAASTYAYYEANAQAGQVPTIMVGASTTRPEDPAGAVSEPTTIDGRPGVVQRMAIGTQFRWQSADGTWTVVSTRDATPETKLRRVAENVAQPPTPLELPVGLTRLPDGYQLARSVNLGADMFTLTLCRAGVDPFGPAGDECLDVRMKPGTAPAEIPQRRGKKMIWIPVDQEKVVDGVLTRATADGTTVVADVGPEHWVEVTAAAGKTPLLRSVAASAVVTP